MKKQSENKEKYIQRKKEIHELSEAIQNKEKHIIHISGIVGTGKSTLVLDLANHYKTYFDKILFLKFSEKTNITPEQFFKKELENSENLNEIINQLALHKHFLVILDNFEFATDCKGNIKNPKWKEMLIKIASIWTFNSKIIITSQVKAVLSKDTRPGRRIEKVLYYRLQGFNENETLQFIIKHIKNPVFTQKNLTKSTLHNLYITTSGNPLVLTLISDTINKSKDSKTINTIINKPFAYIKKELIKQNFSPVKSAFEKNNATQALFKLCSLKSFTIQQFLSEPTLIKDMCDIWNILDKIPYPDEKKYPPNKPIYRVHPLICTYLKEIAKNNPQHKESKNKM